MHNHTITYFLIQYKTQETLNVALSKIYQLRNNSCNLQVTNNIINFS